MSAPTILHLAVDYNTPQRPRTTMAIEALLDATPGVDHVVVAYRRVPRPCSGREEIVTTTSRRVYDFPYFGLPFGVGLHAAMRTAAQRTIARLEQDGVRPAAVHAHKFTFEGIAGWYVARHFGVPLLISLRGEVETKVFRNKPLLRPFLRRVSADAARLYFVSAWFRGEFHEHVIPAPAKERLLPNIVGNIRARIVPQPAENGLVSVFNLNTWRRKGLHSLIAAMAITVRRNPSIRLDIIGGGSPAAQAEVRRTIAQYGVQEQVRLIGAVPNADLLERLPTYRALVLPSRNETFGMVYVEALFAGIPVLFSRGTAIDGYLDGLDIGIAVPPGDVAAIGDALLRLWDENDGYRARIADAGTVLYDRFAPEITAARYRDDLLALTTDL